MQPVLAKPQVGNVEFVKSSLLPDAAKETLTACIVSHSGLAKQYLLQVLAAPSIIQGIVLEEFIEDPRDAQSTVFILDASSLPLPLGECMRRLRIRFAGARYLVIDKTRTALEVTRLLLLGIHGYLNDSSVARELLQAVRMVLSGKLWVTDSVLQHYVSFTSPSNRTAPKAQAPTHREVQILELVEQRFSNREIAQMFGIQESTVKFHLTNIFGKLQVVNRRELAGRGASADLWERLLWHESRPVPTSDAKQAC